MTERQLKREFRSDSKENITEYVIENLAYLAAQPIIQSVFKAEKKDLTLKDLLLPASYYAAKDLILPNIAEWIVNFLAESSLGRWIIGILIKMENTRLLVYLFNVGIIIIIGQILKMPIDWKQIMSLIAFEFGTDELTDYI